MLLLRAGAGAGADDRRPGLVAASKPRTAGGAPKLRRSAEHHHIIIQVVVVCVGLGGFGQLGWPSLDIVNQVGPGVDMVQCVQLRTSRLAPLVPRPASLAGADPLRIAPRLPVPACA